MLSFSPRDVLDEILDIMESVSEGFPTYSYLSTFNSFNQIKIYDIYQYGFSLSDKYVLFSTSCSIHITKSN